MAVMPMKRLELYGLNRDRKEILELLQGLGAVEVHSPQEAEEPFVQADTSQARQELEGEARLLEQAAALLEQYAPAKKGMLSALAGRPPITPEEYRQAAGRAPALLERAREVLDLGRRITEGEGQIQRLKAQLQSLEPWMSLDVPLNTRETQSTRAFIGSFPEELDQERLREALAQAVPQGLGFHIEVLSAQPQQTCVFVLCHKRDASQAEAALRSLGLTYPPLTGELPPARQAQALREEVLQAEREGEAARAELRSRGGERQDLLLAADYTAARAEKYRVLGELWQTPHVFYLTGYLPAEAAPGLVGRLESRFTLCAGLEDPGPEEEPPVKLKNGFFAAPMENIVAGYSLPGKHEVDPSAVMAGFYYVLFGLMLSDAAYGILTALGCGWALKHFRNMEAGMRKSLRMFLFCGLSTTVWGILFGSYFGDCIPVIARTFFHTEITIPALWFEPLADPMRLLVFSFALGILHLFTGLGVQLYQLVKRRQYADALYDVGFWYLLVGGLIVLLLSTEMFVETVGLSFRVPGAVGAAAGALAAVGAVGIVCTAGRESKNPFKRLLKGLYGLYNISGYLSDILSYSRLLALGLATGVIATVFNQMGSMLGDGVVSAIFFGVVFVVGHGMNLAINLLGAYVHTNRLQYVEFFGKFYEGGGRPFTPFTARPRHFQIKEEK